MHVATGPCMHCADKSTPIVLFKLYLPHPSQLTYYIPIPMFSELCGLSGGSRGFLLVLKNYPFSELKNFFVAL